jgi:hypothetical protein
LVLAHLVTVEIETYMPTKRKSEAYYLAIADAALATIKTPQGQQTRRMVKTLEDLRRIEKRLALGVTDKKRIAKQLQILLAKLK